MTKKKVPDPKKPTAAEKIRMIREAQELNVPFKEVLRRWHAEKGLFKPRPRIAFTPATEASYDGTPDELRQSDCVTTSSGMYPPQKDDGPVYEESYIQPFTRVHIYQYFKVYNIEQTEAQIYAMHRKAMQDPEGFAQEYGSELTKLVIQL